MKNSKNLLFLALCLALLIVCSFFLVMTSAGDGNPSITESDTVLYLQYARNIALGHPYVFSPGDAPSTGSTTHLYPFLLAIIYKLGATGNAFIVGTYILNSLFYLGIIVVVWLIARKMAPRIATLALFLTVLSGHTIAATLHMTDIGFFTLLALSLFAAMLYGRNLLALILILLCGLSRPEGLIFATAFALSGGISLLARRKFYNAPGSIRQANFFLLCALIGFLAFGTTLCINYLLTGHAQFMSVANKGHFNQLPFLGAVTHTLFDALAIIKGFLFGLPNTSRQFFIFPLLSGTLAMAGILLYPREDRHIRLCECWLALSAGAVVLTVASSQWQGLSNDRYLAWIYPLVLIYALIGLVELGDRLKARSFLPVLAFLLVLYQLVSIVYVMANSYTAAVELRRRNNFLLQVQSKVPASERIGAAVGGGANFYLPEHKVYSLTGILSPDFFARDFDTQPLRIIDLLKHRPELRFEHWLAYASFLDTDKWAKPFVGEQELADLDSSFGIANTLALYEAKWDTLDGGSVPRLLSGETDGLTLIDELDIGYHAHEQEHDYTHWLRLKNTSIPLVLQTAKLGTNDYSEVGRIILGNESFNVKHVTPDRALKIILRTSKTVDGKCFFGSNSSRINELGLAEILELRLFVDGQEIPCPPLDISREGFSEVALEIPGEYVKTKSPHIKIVGDHISFAYWFYQEKVMEVPH